MERFGREKLPKRDLRRCVDCKYLVPDNFAHGVKWSAQCLHPSYGREITHIKTWRSCHGFKFAFRYPDAA